MGCSGGRHLPAASAKLKILIFGVGGSSIRPLGTITPEETKTSINQLEDLILYKLIQKQSVIAAVAK